MHTTDHAWHIDQDTTAHDLQIELQALEAGRIFTVGTTDTAHPQNGRWYRGTIQSTYTMRHFGDEKLCVVVKVTDVKGETCNVVLEHHEGRFADSKIAFVI